MSNVILIHEVDFEKGTWQFAAARLLLETGDTSPHNRADDLESFYHVLNWMALRYTSHSFSSQKLTSELQRIFDYTYRSPDGRAAGGQSKMSEILSGASNRLAAFTNQPLAQLLETIRNLVAIQYQDEPRGKAAQFDIDRYQSKMNQLRKQEEFTSLFTEALTDDQDWDANGTRVDHPLANLDSRTEKKRKADITQLYRPGLNDEDEHSAKRSKQASNDGGRGPGVEE